MVSVFGKAETQEHNRHLQIFLHGHDSSDRSALAYKCGLLSKCETHRLGCGVDIWALSWTEKWLQEGLRNHLYVRIALLQKLPDEREDLLRILIWNKPHAELRFCPWRNRRLYTFTGIAANHAMNLERRLSP